MGFCNYCNNKILNKNKYFCSRNGRAVCPYCHKKLDGYVRDKNGKFAKKECAHEMDLAFK